MCLHLQQASRIHRKCFRVFAHRDEKSVPCHKIEIEGSGIFVMDMMSKKGVMRQMQNIMAAGLGHNYSEARAK